MKAKDILQELVDACLESGAGQDIDAGCDSNGPLANAMVYLKMASNTEVATDFIYSEE